MVEYIVNLNSKIVHKRVDGMTLEQCNVDQIKKKEVLAYNPFEQLVVEYYECKRCFK